jgi:transposase
MTTSEAFWKFLPAGLDELFEMVKFEYSDTAYNIWLDEKKKLSGEDSRNPNIVARGYTEYVIIQDYPMRGRPVYLHMRKNKWWDKRTNEIFSYRLELPNEEGTRLSAEFVAFLKDEGGDDSPVD